MKKFALLLCVVIMLFGAATSASAAGSRPASFTITGYTTGYDYTVLSNTWIYFELTAAGAAAGALQGEFAFQEWGLLNFNPETGLGTGWGTNSGTVTITADDGSQAVVGFAGQTDSVDVWGYWRVLGGTGSLAGLRGRGSYSGNAGMVFTVTFTGVFN